MYDIYDFIEELGNNVKTITYDAESLKWTVTYKNGLNPDEVGNDEILEFLRNA